MARRTNGVTPPRKMRAAVRKLVLREGVSAAARLLNIGREHALAIAGDLPVPPGVVLLVTSQLERAAEAAA